MRLSLVSEHNIAPGTLVDGQSFGGISALVFRARDQRLLALSDGRAEHGPARMFTIDASRLEPEAAILLGEPLASQTLDLEGMARSGDGSLWVATEGNAKRSPRVPPALWRIDDEGRPIDEVRVPAQLIPTPRGPQRWGVRHNKGIEGLTATPDGRRVIAAVEQALVQDGPAATFEHGTRVRLVVYEGATERAQHAYLTEPVPAASAPGEVTNADNGITALAALDHDRLLVMERAGVAVEGVYTNHVRIYQVSLEAAVDVSHLDALSSTTPVLEKRLVLDLDAIIGDLDPTYARLDNFEAMTLGDAPDGSRRLFVASDDNFSSDQRTALLAFDVEGL